MQQAAKRMVQAQDGDPIVDTDRAWPLLLVRFPRVFSVETARSLVNACERAYDRGERFAAIIDMTSVVRVQGAPARQVITEWLASPSRNEREQAFTVGTALVLTGPLRAVAAAITLVRRPVSPQKWCATPLEAVEWARERLTAAGIASTPEADALYTELKKGRAPRA